MNKWWITATMGAGYVWAVALLLGSALHAVGWVLPPSPSFATAWKLYWGAVFLASVLVWFVMAQEHTK